MKPILLRVRTYDHKDHAVDRRYLITQDGLTGEVKIHAESEPSSNRDTVQCLAVRAHAMSAAGPCAELELHVEVAP